MCSSDLTTTGGKLVTDFEVHSSGTLRVLTETDIAIAQTRAKMRKLMDLYPVSTAAHKTAQEVFDTLTELLHKQNRSQ